MIGELAGFLRGCSGPRVIRWLGKLTSREPKDKRVNLYRLNALRDDDQLVFALSQDGAVLAAAQVALPMVDRDPEPLDLSVPARLHMVPVAVPGNGNGTRLVEEVRSRVFSKLVHDGCLSPAGEAMVNRLDLPMQVGRAMKRLGEERAAELAADLSSSHRRPRGGVNLE